ncbi:hypothetical protein EGR_00800 [Echinococcus granulosus]|uniref:Uncharacterized protein n=1 Tax=Echinococcus granulosus TaxID=6210 RepID=W6UUB8_ECHGR|nr:hypothetical protein EGR_00800 [Echinococcus granulosus]EUB64256.1 hypothetical protein EGR_00800 [Echinococcus granulosus]
MFYEVTYAPKSAQKLIKTALKIFVLTFIFRCEVLLLPQIKRTYLLLKSKKAQLFGNNNKSSKIIKVPWKQVRMKKQPTSSGKCKYNRHERDSCRSYLKHYKHSYKVHLLAEIKLKPTRKRSVKKTPTQTQLIKIICDQHKESFVKDTHKHIAVIFNTLILLIIFNSLKQLNTVLCYYFSGLSNNSTLEA